MAFKLPRLRRPGATPPGASARLGLPGPAGAAPAAAPGNGAGNWWDKTVDVTPLGPGIKARLGDAFTRLRAELNAHPKTVGLVSAVSLAHTLPTAIQSTRQAFGTSSDKLPALSGGKATGSPAASGGQSPPSAEPGFLQQYGTPLALGGIGAAGLALLVHNLRKRQEKDQYGVKAAYADPAVLVRDQPFVAAFLAACRHAGCGEEQLNEKIGLAMQLETVGDAFAEVFEKLAASPLGVPGMDINPAIAPRAPTPPLPAATPPAAPATPAPPAPAPASAALGMKPREATGGQWTQPGHIEPKMDVADFGKMNPAWEGPQRRGVADTLGSGFRGLLGSAGGAAASLAGRIAEPFAWGGEAAGVLPAGAYNSVANAQRDAHNMSNAGTHQLLHPSRSDAFDDAWGHTLDANSTANPRLANVANTGMGLADTLGQFRTMGMTGMIAPAITDAATNNAGTVDPQTRKPLAQAPETPPGVWGPWKSDTQEMNAQNAGRRAEGVMFADNGPGGAPPSGTPPAAAKSEGALGPDLAPSMGSDPTTAPEPGTPPAGDPAAAPAAPGAAPATPVAAPPADAAALDATAAKINPQADPQGAHQFASEAVKAKFGELVKQHPQAQQELQQILAGSPSEQAQMTGMQTLADNLAKNDPAAAQQPDFMSRVGQVWTDMKPGEKALTFLGLGMGVIGLINAISDPEAGAGSWLMALLGLGGLGVMGADKGLFGEQAQKAVSPIAAPFRQMAGMMGGGQTPAAAPATPEQGNADLARLTGLAPDQRLEALGLGQGTDLNTMGGKLKARNVLTEQSRKYDANQLKQLLQGAPPEMLQQMQTTLQDKNNIGGWTGIEPGVADEWLQALQGSGQPAQQAPVRPAANLTPYQSTRAAPNVNGNIVK